MGFTKTSAWWICGGAVMVAYLESPVHPFHLTIPELYMINRWSSMWNVSLSPARCSSKLMEPKKGVLKPPTYNQSIRSTGDKFGLNWCLKQWVGNSLIVLSPSPAIWCSLYKWCKWSESHSVISNSLQPHGLYSPWNSPGQNTGVGNLSLLQGIFPSQGSNPGLPHCRHKGSPRITEWVVYPFFSGSSWPRNQTGVSCIAGRFFTNWAIREAIDCVIT